MSPVHDLLARTRFGLHGLVSLTLAFAALAASGAAWADPPGRVGRLDHILKRYVHLPKYACSD